QNIAKIHRLPNKRQDQPAPVILQLNNRRIRDQIMTKRRSTTVLPGELVATGANEPSVAAQQPVRVYENLSPYMRKLRWLAKSTAQQAGYKFVWVRDGKLFVRSQEGTPVIRIRHEDDLHNIISR